MQLFYDENQKIGLPIFLDHDTDIVTENDLYYYNFMHKYDKLQQFVKETNPERHWKIEQHSLWMSLWKNMTNFNEKKRNQIIPEKDIQLLSIFDCNFLEEKNMLFNSISRDSYINEKIIVYIEIKNPL